ALVALTAIVVLWAVGRWYSGQNRIAKPLPVTARDPSISRRRLFWIFVVLGLLVISKNIYMASMTSFYAFFLIEKFGLSASQAQVYLFVFLGAAAAGTFLGGPIGDRVGRKSVIWVSILG